MYSVGIIGCGFIACEALDSHALAYKENPNTELVDFIDSDKEKAHNAYIQWTGKHNALHNGTGYDPAGNRPNQFDIASICTPIGDGKFLTRLHRVCEACDHGVKAILLEKPIAYSLEEADKIIDYCKQHNILLVVNHQRRFINPKFTFSRGIVHTGTHAFDLIRKLFGEITTIHPDRVWTESGVVVDIEYKDSDVGEFTLDCTRSTERMIPRVVSYMVRCLDEGYIHQMFAQEARRDLEVCLQYQDIKRRKELLEIESLRGNCTIT
jgi:predicted dehydrogenase